MTNGVSIGAFAYRVQVRRPRNYQIIDFSADSLGKKLRDCYVEFWKSQLEAADTEETIRRWYYEQQKDSASGSEGLVQYGRTGFTSLLVDPKTKTTKYERETSDLEIIPLFNRIWLPDSGTFGIWVFQAFSGYSCNNLMLNAFSKFFREKFSGLVLSVAPIVPAEIKQFREAPVRAVILRSKSGGEDIADRQLGQRTKDVGISMEFTAPPRETLGLFSSIKDRFTGAQKDEAMSLDGIHFDEAFAKVSINGRLRTIAMTGVSNRTGLIDLSGEVKIGPNGHPKPDSISKEFGTILSDLATEMTR
jgi:hypothetical protein